MRYSNTSYFNKSKDLRIDRTITDHPLNVLAITIVVFAPHRRKDAVKPLTRELIGFAEHLLSTNGLWIHANALVDDASRCRQRILQGNENIFV